MDPSLSNREISESSKLQGISNYAIWSFKVSTILKGERLWRVVNPSTPLTSSTSTSDVGESSVATAAATAQERAAASSTVEVLDLEELKHKAVRIIATSVKDSLLPHIMHLSEPREMWIKLRDLYESKSTNRRLTLKSQLYSLQMSDKMSIDEHLRNVSSLIGQLANINVLVPDDELVDRVLTSLPSNWSIFRQLVSARENPISFSELESLLLQEDGIRSRLKNREEVEEALSANEINYVGRKEKGGRSNRGRGRGQKTSTYLGAHSGDKKQSRGNQTSGPAPQTHGRSRTGHTGSSHAGHAGGSDYTGGGEPAEGGDQRRDSYSAGRANRSTASGDRAYGGTQSRGSCHVCGSPEHWAPDCEITLLRQRLRELERDARPYQQQKNNNQVNLAQAPRLTIEEQEDTHQEEEQDHEVYATEVSIPNLANNWYFDSGASTHVTGNKDLLSNISEGPTAKITTASGITLPVAAKGAINLPGNKSISNVLYVPGLCKNLLSIGKLADAGHYTLFGPKTCWVYARGNSNQVLFTGTRIHSNSLYRLNTSLTGTSCKIDHPSLNSASLSPLGLTELWHKRMAHLNYQSLYNLSRQDLVTGLPLLKNIQKTCEACILGKQHIHPIPRFSLTTTSQPLELVHSDLCGPLPRASLTGHRYILTFIDDFSRRSWVYFIASKGDTFSCFQTFHKMTSNETSCALICLRTDRGGEYLSSNFINYCEKHGIQRHLTAAYTPQQNGVAERKNRHLCETMRTLIFGANLPTTLWEEAVRTANYIGNRMPHRTLKSTTPLERYTSQKPNLAHLRIFGCRSYVHVKNRDKLQPKSISTVFVGYDDQSKAYRCYDPTRHKILISRDVEFDEDILGLATLSSSPTSDYDILNEFVNTNLHFPPTAPTSPISLESPSHTSSLPYSITPYSQTGKLFPSKHATPLKDPHNSNPLTAIDPPSPNSKVSSLAPTVSQPATHSPDITSSGQSRLLASPEIPRSPTSGPTRLASGVPQILPSPIRASSNQQPTPNSPSNLLPGFGLHSPPSTPEPTPLQPTSLHIPLSNVSQHPPRRSTRFRKQSIKLDDYILAVTPENFDLCLTESSPDLISDNINFKQATTHPGWVAAMRDELNSIYQNETWDLVPLPPGKKPISSKWVYKTKPALPGAAPRLKARLVARGFEQRQGIDFDEVFAPVVKWSTIRTLTARAAQLRQPIHHLDIKTAFLYGNLEEEVYMQQPEGFIKPGTEHLVCKLKKALYGLRQSPRAWYERIYQYLLSKGFKRSCSDQNMFSKGKGLNKILLVIYVDDLFITGGKHKDIRWLKRELNKEFDITDLGLVTRYLGVEFKGLPNGIFLNQTEFALQLLRDTGMTDCKSAHIPLPPGLQLSTDMSSPPTNSTDYCQIVGKLIFLTTTRPDIAFAVGLVSRFMSNPQQAHLTVVYHILRYIKKTATYGLLYSHNNTAPAQGFTDADWAACSETRRSTSGYCFLLAGSAITWQSKRQPTVAKSSTESEYISLSIGASEAVWLRRLLTELDFPSDTSSSSESPPHPTIDTIPPLSIYCDNQSALKLAKNPVFHARTKHIEVHFHFIREYVLRGDIHLHYIPTDSQPADIFTKPLSRPKFERHRRCLGIIDIETLAHLPAS